MDQQIRLLGKIKREISKIVNEGATKEEKLLLIEFGEKRLTELRGEIAGG